MKQLLTFLLFVLVASGCSTLRRPPHLSVQVRVVNKSSRDIRFVQINTDAPHGGSGFGFFGGAGPRNTKGATAGGTTIVLSPHFTIDWKEDGQQKQATLDMQRYHSVSRQIRFLQFWYHGKGQWEVIAQAGLRRDSEVLTP